MDRIHWSISGAGKLLQKGEGAVPKVTYWELGNESDVPVPYKGFMLDQAAYHRYYKMITKAMLKVDPAIKVGPSFISGLAGCGTKASDPKHPGRKVFQDPLLRMDFVCFHPYWVAMSCEAVTAAKQETFLREIRGQLQV